MSELLSVEECKAHIQEVRRSNGVDLTNTGSNKLLRGYESMLKLLSAQLYSDPAHFIYELIQNADDNTYHSHDQPQAVLAYHQDGHFFFGCNEIGFTKANVEAICDIDQSTKTLNKGKEGCIGEKGIGFKSVFKVASEVWVRSNNYSFKFDESKQLGIITPAWDEFPHLPKELRMNTMFCIKIKDLGDRDIVEEQLTTILEPSTLMFLRRLSKIRIIKLDNGGNIFEEITMSYRQQWHNGMNIMVTTKIKDAHTRLSGYFFSEYMVQNMPAAEQRTGVTQSSIKLAFPIGFVDGKTLPLNVSQNLHAFLPVCSSGLKFIVHADFLLVASRQNIDESQSWNRHLQIGLARALLHAVTEFNTTCLKYLWPKYLPKTRVPLKFLQEALDNFFTLAKDSKILEARSGTLAKPSLMMLVPDRFKDEDGVPLLTSSDDQYLSSKYNTSDLSALVTQTLDWANFFALLKDYVSTQTDEFHDGPGSWHSKVCEILLSDGSRHHDMMGLFLLPIAPLSDGSWTSIRSPEVGFGRRKRRPHVTLYLPPSEMNIRIRDFVSLPIISHEAANDKYRLEFYKKFGAKELNHKDVLESILKRHQDGISNADAPLLVSHAEYIFSSRLWLDTRDLSLTLWVANSESSHSRGSDLHMDVPDPKKQRKLVSVYFSDSPTVAKFIHPSYIRSFEHDPATHEMWLAWLQERLGVHVIPRLKDKSSNSLSKEFRWIVNNVPSREWLMCLRHYWTDCSLDKSSMAQVRDELSDVLVACTDGFRFVDLLQEDDEDWRKLSCFSVITSRDLKFCIEILTNYSKNAAEPAEEEVIDLYKEIQGFCQHSLASREVAKSAFSKDSLVYLNGKWLPMDVCVWESPKCLHKIVPIASRFDSVKTLFKDYLTLPDARASHFVNELLELGGDMGEIDRIRKILLELSARLHSEMNCDLGPLKECRMFPVITTAGSTRLTSTLKAWYIPDQPSLKESFLGFLFLLDFDITDQQRLKPLLDRMKLVWRRLSKRVVEETVVVGREQAVQNNEQSKFLQDRAHYLSCLTDAGDGQKLKNLTVWAAENVITKLSVSANNYKTYGKDQLTSVLIEDSKVFVSTKDLAEDDSDIAELADRLADIAKFPAEHKDLVLAILMLDSNTRIEKHLGKRKINFEKAKEPELADQLLENSAPEVVPSQLQHPVVRMEAKAGSSSTSLLSHASVSASTSAHEEQPKHPAAGPNFHSGNREAIENRKPSLHASRASTRPPPMRSSLSQRMVRVHSSSTAQHMSSGSAYPPEQRTRSAGGPKAEFSVPLQSMNKIVDGAEPTHLFSSSSHSRPLTPEGYTGDSPSAISFGEKGERKVYFFLKEMLDGEFDDSMWTSHVRGQYTSLPFEQDESDFADFTVPDRSGRITGWLVSRGCEQAQDWKNKSAEVITYHIEVKCTAGASTEGFHVSQNQIEMASRYQLSDLDVPKDVYIILRVSNLTANGGNAYVQPFVDPWSMLAQGTIVSTAPQGYVWYWLN